MKELSESESSSLLSTHLDNVMTLFPVVTRKIMFATLLKSRIGSSEMQTRVLEGLGTGGLKPSEISKMYSISKPNVTTLVNKLIDRGYAERLPDDKDRRAIRIIITDKGKRLIIKKRKIVKEFFINAWKKLNPDEINDICKSMESFRYLLTKLDEIF